MPESVLWTSAFIRGTLTNFFLLLNVFILFVVISTYAMETIGSSPGEAGFSVGIFVLGALIARLFSGQLIERIGQRRMLFLGIMLGLAMTILYFVSHTIWQLCIVRIVHGFGYGIASVAIVTVVTINLPRSRQGEGVGYFMMGTILATAIGPFLALFFIQHGGFPIIFLVAILALLVSLALAFSLTFPETRAAGERSRRLSKISVSSFIEPKAIPISIVCAFLYLAYSSIMAFLTPYAREIYLADFANYFFVVFSIAILVSRPVTGRLFDSKGENFVIYPVFPLFGIGFFILSRADHTLTLLTASVFLGLAYGIVQACGMATALKGAPPHRIGFASSTFYVIVDIGVASGPFLVGLLIPYVGYRGMYMCMAGFSFACILVYYLLHGRRAALVNRT